MQPLHTYGGLSNSWQVSFAYSLQTLIQILQYLQLLMVHDSDSQMEDF